MGVLGLDRRRRVDKSMIWFLCMKYVFERRTVRWYQSEVALQSTNALRSRNGTNKIIKIYKMILGLLIIAAITSSLKKLRTISLKRVWRWEGFTLYFDSDVVRIRVYMKNPGLKFSYSIYYATWPDSHWTGNSWKLWCLGNSLTARYTFSPFLGWSSVQYQKAMYNPTFARWWSIGLRHTSAKHFFSGRVYHNCIYPAWPRSLI